MFNIKNGNGYCQDEKGYSPVYPPSRGVWQERGGECAAEAVKAPEITESANNLQAQGTRAEMPARGDRVPFTLLFRNGNNITLTSPTEFELKVGHVYLVSFVLNGNLGAEGFVSVYPVLNGRLEIEYGAVGHNNAVQTTVGLSTTFLVSTATEMKTLYFVVSSSEAQISVSAVSASLVQVQ